MDLNKHDQAVVTVDWTAI